MIDSRGAPRGEQLVRDAADAPPVPEEGPIYSWPVAASTRTNVSDMAAGADGRDIRLRDSGQRFVVFPNSASYAPRNDFRRTIMEGFGRGGKVGSGSRNHSR